MNSCVIKMKVDEITKTPSGKELIKLVASPLVASPSNGILTLTVLITFIPDGIRISPEQHGLLKVGEEIPVGLSVIGDGMLFRLMLERKPDVQ